MPENILDCQSLPCPGPVIEIKRFLERERPAGLSVLVDNEPALENVTRFLKANGYQSIHSTRTSAGVWRIQAGRDANLPPAATAPMTAGTGASQTDSGSGKTLVLILTPVFGSGDDVLGGKLMKNFIATLPEMGSELWRIVLLNGGVTLTAKDSPVLDALRTLETSGVDVLVCGTCLEHFGLLDQKAVGQTTNMLDVVTSLQLAQKVIRV